MDVTVPKSTSLPAMGTVRGMQVTADLANEPAYIDGHDTIPALFQARCAELGEAVAMREKDLGIWLSWSWNDWFENARTVAGGLAALGLTKGDVISILSEDRKEWVWIDHGAMGLGLISSGIYTTDAAKQVEYLVNDSGTKVLFVENDEQLDKYLTVRDAMPGLVKCVVIDPEGLHDFEDEQVIFLDELYRLGRAHAEANPGFFERAIANVQPDDTAILVYTSGTTGMPKGAMVSHGNIMWSIASSAEVADTQAGDDQICFLPLCHILERLFSGMAPIANRTVLNFAESPETVFDNLQEVSPHTFVAVPRLWEKIFSRVSILTGDATRMQRFAFARALAAGRRRQEAISDGRTLGALDSLSYRFWDFAVLRNLRRMLGMDRIRRGGSGAAPIAPELLDWFRSIGVPIYEGYGMTETSGIISINWREADKVGTVGRAVRGAELRIAPDGEIQYRAGNVFQGYWGKPDKTAETFTEDGWLRTGDVGRLDNEGYLTITGRLKDIIITAGGKNITPAEWENRLKFSPYVSDCVIIGDRRKFLTCLVMIDQENVEKFAQDRRIPFSNFASLCAAPEVQALIGEEIAKVNKDFARVEQVKDFRLIDILLTAEDDELTATMKLKRSFVEKKHEGLIAQMYGG